MKSKAQKHAEKSAKFQRELLEKQWSKPEPPEFKIKIGKRDTAFAAEVSDAGKLVITCTRCPLSPEDVKEFISWLTDTFDTHKGEVK